MKPHDSPSVVYLKKDNLIFYHQLHYLVVGFSITQLLLGPLVLLPYPLAPRLFTPVVFALFRLIRKIAAAGCLSRWRLEIEETIDNAVKV